MNMDALKRDMRLYRMGLAPLPQSYIALHHDAAYASISVLCLKLGLRVIATEMVNDGWMDGMRVVRAICEDRNGDLRDMRWSDSSGGAWYERKKSGGQSIAFIPDNRPGYL